MSKEKECWFVWELSVKGWQAVIYAENPNERIPKHSQPVFGSIRHLIGVGMNDVSIDMLKEKYPPPKDIEN